jgi:hypothetical protein
MTPAQAAAVKLIPWLNAMIDAQRHNKGADRPFKALLAFLEEAKGMVPEDDAERLRKALEDIALLDEADGHELRELDALKAVAIATRALGKHPSEIYQARIAQEKNDD